LESEYLTPTGYVTYPEAVDGSKVRRRGSSFFDHYSQATMFFASQSPAEQQHLIKALRFELGKCSNADVRARMVQHLAQIDGHLAASVAEHLGLTVGDDVAPPANGSVPADGDPAEYMHRDLVEASEPSPALGMAGHVPAPITGRKFAILVADGFDATGVLALTKALAAEKAAAVLVGPRVGSVLGDDGKAYNPPFSILTTSSVLFLGPRQTGICARIGSPTNASHSTFFAGQSMPRDAALPVTSTLIRSAGTRENTAIGFSSGIAG
jgi:catalase